MTDITGTRIKPGDVLVFKSYDDDGLGFFVACVEKSDHFTGASTWWQGWDEGPRSREVFNHSCVYGDQERDLLIVAHAAQLDKPTWPRELRNWIYETWEERRQG